MIIPPSLRSPRHFFFQFFNYSNFHLSICIYRYLIPGSLHFHSFENSTTLDYNPIVTAIPIVCLRSGSLPTWAPQSELMDPWSHQVRIPVLSFLLHLAPLFNLELLRARGEMICVQELVGYVWTYHFCTLQRPFGRV